MREKPDRALHARVGDEGIDSAPLTRHAVYSRGNLIEIADVGAQTQSGTASVFDFKFGNVEFALTAAEKTDVGFVCGEAER